MLGHLLKLIVLFFVIFDPFMSFAVFYSSTRDMEREERRRTATMAILVASTISVSVLLFGERILELFSTDIDDFKVAGGIVLGVLGVKMALGQPITDSDSSENRSGRAIAAIIGSPLLTGPAAITAIIVSVDDFGMILTAIAIGIVLTFTALLFYQATLVNRFLGKTLIQVLSTILGLITLSWGVMLIKQGFGI